MSDRTHLVPQAVVDCYEKALTESNQFARDNYILRLESIRDYCDKKIRELKR